MMDEKMLELREMLAGQCAFCERELGEGEQRVVLPAYVQERDRFVREGVVGQRVICVECAMGLKSRERARAKRATQSEVRRVVAFLRMLQG
ncbi:MAG: hypothetical protein KGH57_01475 [Candidatus Micrarchaeota archaeon]|nr:hypothetical protein [Candidatus Micrarchaeota archaeon]